MRCWVIFSGRVRFVAGFVCCVGACAWVVSGGDSGSLGFSENSLFENISFGSWRERFSPFFLSYSKKGEVFSFWFTRPMFFINY